MKNLDGKITVSLSILSAAMAIIFAYQLFGSFVREEARKAAIQEIELRAHQHGTGR